jgi:DNA replication protein DnaD
MGNDGWISIHRKIKENWIFKKNRIKSEFEAWIIMLMEVNHTKEKVSIKGEIIVCERGESIKSLDTWAHLFGWTKSRVRRFFKLLESDTMIVLKPTHKTTHLTICNYDIYQKSRNNNETIMKRKRNTDETQMALNNKYNNDNNDKNDKNSINNTHPLQIWIEENLQSVRKLSSQLTEKQIEELLKEYSIEKIKDILGAMENYKPLLTKYKSVNLTLRNWIKRDKDNNNGKNQHNKPRGSIDYNKYAEERAASHSEEETGFELAAE